jgi:Arc-like DNA binding domain
MARKSDDDIISTRLRMPTGLHRMLTQAAKQNNRSLNSEILWAIAHHLGGEAPKFVEHLAAEQRRIMLNVMRAISANPEKAAELLKDFKGDA